jgi:2-C-methyl-D-erythritol 2,4-cyclodiphosphate synthase
MVLIREKGYEIGNIDSTICLQTPKIKLYIPEMQKVIAACMRVDTDLVSIKATTTEKLSFVGREEGVSAYATVLINKILKS